MPYTKPEQPRSSQERQLTEMHQCEVSRVSRDYSDTSKPRKAAKTVDKGGNRASGGAVPTVSKSFVVGDKCDSSPGTDASCGRSGGSGWGEEC